MNNLNSRRPQEKREYEFYSPRISNAQRLPNGNTLICEGDFGRLFEVTRDGELVWEYVNPYFGEGPTGLTIACSAPTDIAKKKSLEQRPEFELDYDACRDLRPA